MATIEEQLASDLGHVFDDFPCTFTHSGTAYSGTMSSLTKNRNLDEGGFFPEFDAIFELKVGERASLFARQFHQLNPSHQNGLDEVDDEAFLLVLKDHQWFVFRENQENRLFDLRQKAETLNLPYLFYDPFDAPEYTYLAWHQISQSLMENWIGSSFESTDFIHRFKNKSLDSFPITWNVMF